MTQHTRRIEHTEGILSSEKIKLLFCPVNWSTNCISKLGSSIVSVERLLHSRIVLGKKLHVFIGIGACLWISKTLCL